MARPGEFTERAFHNDKLDLAQAEAIADLIDAGSAEAARAALRSLAGEFSREVGELAELVMELRVFVEAAIDFPDEDAEFLASDEVRERLAGDRGALCRHRRIGAAGQGVARRAAGGDRRPAECRQVFLAERARGLRCRDRHGHTGHDPRRVARAHPRGRAADPRRGHGGAARFLGRRRDRGRAPRARRDRPRGSRAVRRGRDGRARRRRAGGTAGGNRGAGRLEQDRSSGGVPGAAARESAGRFCFSHRRHRAAGAARAVEIRGGLPGGRGRRVLGAPPASRRADARAEPLRAGRGAARGARRRSSWSPRNCARRTRRSARSRAPCRATSCSARSSRVSASASSRRRYT